LAVYIVTDAECLRPGSSVLGGSDVIATQMEQVVDLIVGCEEALGLAGLFVIMTRGGRICFFSSFNSSRLAARLSRRL
jgi:hypothetical protein